MVKRNNKRIKKEKKEFNIPISLYLLFFIVVALLFQPFIKNFEPFEKDLVGQAVEVVECDPVFPEDGPTDIQHKFYVNNREGCPVAWFSDSGEVALKGSMGMFYDEVHDYGTYRVNGDEAFLFENNGVPLLAIDQLGNMYHKGSHIGYNPATNVQYPFDETKNEFRIKNSEGVVNFLLNEEGNIWMRGGIIQGRGRDFEQITMINRDYNLAVDAGFEDNNDILLMMRFRNNLFGSSLTAEVPPIEGDRVFKLNQVNGALTEEIAFKLRLLDDDSQQNFNHLWGPYLMKNTQYNVKAHIWIPSEYVGDAPRLRTRGLSTSIGRSADMSKRDQWQELSFVLNTRDDASGAIVLQTTGTGPLYIDAVSVVPETIGTSNVRLNVNGIEPGIIIRENSRLDHDIGILNYEGDLDRGVKYKLEIMNGVGDILQEYLYSNSNIIRGDRGLGRSMTVDSIRWGDHILKITVFIEGDLDTPPIIITEEIPVKMRSGVATADLVLTSPQYEDVYQQGDTIPISWRWDNYNNAKWNARINLWDYNLDFDPSLRRNYDIETIGGFDSYSPETDPAALTSRSYSTQWQLPNDILPGTYTVRVTTNLVGAGGWPGAGADIEVIPRIDSLPALVLGNARLLVIKSVDEFGNEEFEYIAQVEQNDNLVEYPIYEFGGNLPNNLVSGMEVYIEGNILDGLLYLDFIDVDVNGVRDQAESLV